MMEHTKQGISGSTLKIIAMLTMLTDHIGAVIVYGMASQVAGVDAIQYGNLMLLCHVLRCIGRMAFPIYCFLLVEGITYTRSKGKYALRLFLFAIISELPFDLAIHGGHWSLASQNVFFTLLIGVLVLTCWEAISGKTPEADRYQMKWILGRIAMMLCWVIGCIMAYILHTDYGAVGVLVIGIIYLVRKSGARVASQGTGGNAAAAVGAGCVALALLSITELFALLDMLFVSRYNGKRGINIKYLFYAFYPLHLLILYVIARVCGYLP